MKNILKFIPIILAAILVFGGVAYAASNPISQTPAIFQTVLSSPVAISDTTMYIQNDILSNGVALTGYQCFTVSPQSTNTEYVCGTMSGDTVINLQRGLDPLTATTTDSSLTFTHRRGDAVQITNFPTLQRLANIFGGYDVIPGIITYDPSISTSSIAANRGNIPNVGLLDDTAFNGAGVINATASAKGTVQLATGIQAASSTLTGSTGASLALTSSIATSTFNAATAPLKVVVTNNAGTIDPGFINLANYTGTATLASSTVIGSTYAFNIGKNEFATSTSGSWTVPNGITTILVRLVGGGGGGAVGGSACNSGGGSGGYVEGPMTVSGTISWTIGPGGVANSAGSSSSIGSMIAGGGTEGTPSNSIVEPGGIPGTASGGTFHSNGNVGSPCYSVSNSQTATTTSMLGSSVGYGGPGGQAGGAGELIVNY